MVSHILPIWVPAVFVQNSNVQQKCLGRALPAQNFNIQFPVWGTFPIAQSGSIHDGDADDGDDVDNDYDDIDDDDDDDDGDDDDDDEKKS